MITITLRDKGTTHGENVIWDVALPIGIAREQFEIMLKLIKEEDAEFSFKASYGIDGSFSWNHTNIVDLYNETVNSIEDIILQIALNTGETDFGHFYIGEDDWLANHFKDEDYYENRTEEEINKAVKLYEQEQKNFYSSDFDTKEIIEQRIKDDANMFHVQKLKYLQPILRQLLEVESYEAPFWSEREIMSVESEKRFMRYLNNKVSIIDMFRTETGRLLISNLSESDKEYANKVKLELQSYIAEFQGRLEELPNDFSRDLCNDYMDAAYKNLVSNANEHSINLNFDFSDYTVFLTMVESIYYKRYFEFSNLAVCKALEAINVKTCKIESIENASYFESFKKISEIGVLFDSIIDLSNKRIWSNPDEIKENYNTIFN